MADRLRITESAPAIKFAAQYLARELGFFRDERLEVVEGVDAGPGGSWLAANLRAGKAEIALGGIWLPMLYRQTGLADDIPFACICHRNPAVLIARHRLQQGFTWSSLTDRRVLLALAVTSQWMFLEGVLLEHKVAPAQVRFVRDLHVETQLELWRAGYGDFFLVEPAVAETLVQEGFFVAATLAQAAGAVPWSVYYAPRQALAERDSPVERFRRAVARATAVLVGDDPGEAVAILARRFPSTSKPAITRAVTHLRESGVWRADTLIDRAATLRYAGMMQRYGLLDPAKPVPFVDDNRFFA